EALVLELEMAVALANAALAKRHQLLALGKRAHGDSPFFKRDWHRTLRTTDFVSISPRRRTRRLPCGGAPFYAMRADFQNPPANRGVSQPAARSALQDLDEGGEVVVAEAPPGARGEDLPGLRRNGERD